MSPYRGPDRTRMMQQQSDYQFASHSHSMTLARYVSATGGVDVAGYGPTGYWTYAPISALLKPLPVQGEYQSPAGRIAEGMFQVVTREELNRDDRLTWNGVSYRVESDPIQATLLNTWISIVVREDS